MHTTGKCPSPPHVINARRGGRPVHLAKFLTSSRCPVHLANFLTSGRCPVHLANFLTSAAGRCPVHLAKFLTSAAGRCPVHLAIYGEGGRQAGGEVIVRSRGSHKREKKIDLYGGMNHNVVLLPTLCWLSN